MTLDSQSKFLHAALKIVREPVSNTFEKQLALEVFMKETLLM